ncbi:MAG: acetolactate synthase small subunit [Gemmatimonadales bacterium]
MTAPIPSLVVTALLPEDLLALNRAIGIIRRRNLDVISLVLGPSGRPGMNRLSCVIDGEAATTERMANQLRKMIGVAQVLVQPVTDCTVREHALIRVRVSTAQLAGLFDTIAVYDALVVEERSDELTLELTGAPPLVGSLLRALEPFGVLEIARGGTLAVMRPAESAAESSRPPATMSRLHSAVTA